MALVYNCKDDVAAVAFISWLQVSHFFYKYLVKHKVTKVRNIFSRAQKYIQSRMLIGAKPIPLPNEGMKGRNGS